MSSPLQLGIQLANKAAHAIENLTRNQSTDQLKADASIVTEADLFSNQILTEGIYKAFPHHAILSEETALSGNINSTYIWVIDPLDGTKAYAKGIKGYSVMIALFENEKLLLGVVKDPKEGHLYYAEAGKGCFYEHKGQTQKIRVSQRSNLKEMPLIHSTGVPQQELEHIQQTLSCPVLDPINSVGIKVGLLIRQEGDIYYNHHPISYWDLAAPQIILEEAKGKISNLEGKQINYSFINSSYRHDFKTLASNNTMHEEILGKLQLY